MFDNLSRRLSTTFDRLRGRTHLTEDMLDSAFSDIRTALLEADVALPVVKQILAEIRTQAIGEKIVENVRPHEMITKIVYDSLVKMLGGDAAELDLSNKPSVILMSGLQGTGKTTTAGKLALYLRDKKNKRVLLASTDIYRPMAREQLTILGNSINIDVLDIIESEKPSEIAKRAIKVGADYDVVIIDTAGRLQIDEKLMTEIIELKKITKPDNVLLTVDAMAGQESVAVARAFHEALNITGIILTRADGDARGGAALSMRIVSGAPILFTGIGEKINDIEQFYPDRLASRILGMGDVVTLVEKAQENLDEKETERLVGRFMDGKFDLDDMLKQIKQMKRLGSLGGLLKLIPGIGKMAGELKDKVNDKTILHQEAMLLSMTPNERKNPSIIFAARKQRIARGSGTSVSDVEKLLKNFEKMQSVMKQMQSMGGMQNMMKMAQDMQKQATENGDMPPEYMLGKK